MPKHLTLKGKATKKSTASNGFIEADEDSDVHSEEDPEWTCKTNDGSEESGEFVETSKQQSHAPSAASDQTG